MAHTDRDDTKWFWKDHFRRPMRGGPRKCGLWSASFRVRGHCWCDHVHNGFTEPYKFEQGIPSYLHKDERRAERAHARNLMNKARNGHIDWDDLTVSYRRPWYW